ncbi:MAG TPA: hypothetical protein VIN10_03300 [Bacteroidales bacterium]
MLKKKLIFTVVVLLAFIDVHGQVFGVSADKLVAINPLSIPTGTVEFEPAFGYLYSSTYFENNGGMQSTSFENDSITNLQCLFFRTTYGFAKNFEAGVLISANLSNFSAGLKYTFFQAGNTAGAILLGTTFSNESDLVFRNTGFFGKTYSIATGVAFTTLLSEKVEIDYDFQYQNLLDKSGSQANDYFATADASFKIKEGFRIASGLSYRYNQDKAEKRDAYLLTMNTGLIISPGRTFIIVLNVPYDLMGRNTDKYVGFTMALTIFLD